MSWFVSPILTGIAAAVIFFVVRTLVLRRKNAYQLSFWTLPPFVCLTVWINVYFILTKVSLGPPHNPQSLETSCSIFSPCLPFCLHGAVNLGSQAFQSCITHSLRCPCKSGQVLTRCCLTCGMCTSAVAREDILVSDEPPNPF